jgi:hypothetical protein
LTTRSFEIPIRSAERRLSSTLQHKLRVVMKCYTITNFQINENDLTFSFNKTNKIRGITLKDSKDYFGSYYLEKNNNHKEDKEYTLTINIH